MKVFLKTDPHIKIQLWDAVLTDLCNSNNFSKESMHYFLESNYHIFIRGDLFYPSTLKVVLDEFVTHVLDINSSSSRILGDFNKNNTCMMNISTWKDFNFTSNSDFDQKARDAATAAIAADVKRRSEVSVVVVESKPNAEQRLSENEREWNIVAAKVAAAAAARSAAAAAAAKDVIAAAARSAASEAENRARCVVSISSENRHFTRSNTAGREWLIITAKMDAAAAEVTAVQADKEAIKASKLASKADKINASFASVTSLKVALDAKKASKIIADEDKRLCDIAKAAADAIADEEKRIAEAPAKARAIANAKAALAHCCAVGCGIGCGILIAIPLFI
jgi:hypothetical protein